MHHRRRARKAKATGTHTADDILAQYERQSGACYWCDAEVGQDYHVDHVVPLSKGGSDGPDNLVIACPTCNLRKGAKMPDEFVKDLAVAQVAAA
jgi:5-methylcytosine-specific restriction endonuclease McrA